MMLSPIQRIVIAISVPAVITVGILFLEVRTGYSLHHRASSFWYARDSWWVWIIAIVVVTAFELFIWRKPLARTNDHKAPRG